MLSALRGVLKRTWRLGLMDADPYRRAADVENVRASRLLSGRALASEEITKLFETFTGDRREDARPHHSRGLRPVGVVGAARGVVMEDFEIDEADLVKRFRVGDHQQQLEV